MTKILYCFLRERAIIERDAHFERLEQHPSTNEVASYPAEYRKRLSMARSQDARAKSKRAFLLQRQLWHCIEFVYLVVRKVLRFFGTDIERVPGGAICAA